MFKRLLLIQFFSSVAIVSSWIYIPEIAKNLHASNLEIGLVVGSYSSAFFVSSILFGRASDMYGRRLFLTWGLFASFVFFFLQYFSKSYVLLLITRILSGFCIGIFPAALIALIYETDGRLGRFSSYGALGWSIGIYASGVIAEIFGIYIPFIQSSLLFLLSFLASLGIKETPHRIHSIPLFPKDIFVRNWPLYIAFLFRHTGANVTWTFWILYLKDLGASSFWQAAIIGINPTLQFFIMFFFTDTKRGEIMLSLGFLFSVLTFLLYSVVQNYLQIIPIQFLLALSWSFIYVGSLKVLAEKNVEKATAVGLFNSTMSISMVIGPFIAGFFMSFVENFRLLMLFSALLSFSGFIIYQLGLTRRKKRE